MKLIQVYTDTVKHIQMSDSQLTTLRNLYRCSSAFSNLLSQYHLFCKSISDFKKLMYSRSVDAYLLDHRYSSTTDFFLDAENSTMHVTASFLKFTDLLPSLLQNCFPDSGIRNEVINKRKLLYDGDSGSYRFLCELRNAIVHRSIDLTVSVGENMRLLKEEAISKFGYYINFDSFVSDSVEKNNKKVLLNERRAALVNKNGQVDVNRVLSDASFDVYLELVAPYKEPLKNAVGNLWVITCDFLTDNEILNPTDFAESHMMLGDETIFSSVKYTKTLHYLEDLRSPIRSSITAIAPDLIR